MCLTCRFEQKLKTMEPGETVTFTRDAIVSMVGRREPCSRKSAAERPLVTASPPAAEQLYSVPELAERFGIGLSTARGWCQAEIFGDAAGLKVGREWSIPEAWVSDVGKRLAKGWRVIDNRWVSPGAEGQGQESGKSDEGPGESSLKAKRMRGRDGVRTASAEAVDGGTRAVRTESVNVRTDVRVVVGGAESELLASQS